MQTGLEQGRGLDGGHAAQDRRCTEEAQRGLLSLQSLPLPFLLSDAGFCHWPTTVPQDKCSLNISSPGLCSLLSQGSLLCGSLCPDLQGGHPRHRAWVFPCSLAVTHTALCGAGDTQSAGHGLQSSGRRGQAFKSVCSRAISLAPCRGGHDKSDALTLCA